MKTDVLALVATLGGNQSQSPQIATYYDRLMRTISDRQVFVTMDFIPVVANQAEYALPASAGTLLAAFYDDTMLSIATFKEMESLAPSWRDQIGTPIAYLMQDEPYNTIRLFPVPPRVSPNWAFYPHGSPFGLDFPVDTITVLHAEARTDLPSYLDLPLALMVLAREFQRDSDHTNPDFSAGCTAIGDLLLTLAL